MTLFDPTFVSEDGHTASVDLSLPDAPMPFVLHLFGQETVERWVNAEEGSRSRTAIAVMTDLRTFASLMGIDWWSAEATSQYNRFCAQAGITEHALEFAG